MHNEGEPYVRRSVSSVLLLISLSGLLLAPSVAVAQAVVPRNEFLISTDTGDGQRGPGLAALPASGFVVAWEGREPPSPVPRVLIQRYAAYDDPAGPLIEVGLPWYSQEAAIAAFDDNSFVATWTSDVRDGDQDGIFGQRFDSVGALVGSEFQINSYTTSDQRVPSVSALEDGGYFVAWNGLGDSGSGSDIWGRRFDAAGSPIGTDIRINTSTQGHQRAASVSDSGNGSFVVVWGSYLDFTYDETYGVFGQRFDQDAMPIGTEFQLNSYTTGRQISPSVAMHDDGSFIVVWANHSPPVVFGRQFDASGAPIGTPFEVSTYTSGGDPFSLAIDAQTDGSTIAAWSIGNGEVLGQRLDESGVRIGTHFQVNSYTTQSQNRPVVGAHGDGTFTIAWSGDGPSGDAVFGRSYIAAVECAAVPEGTCLIADQAQIVSKEDPARRAALKLKWKKVSGAFEVVDVGDVVNGATRVAICAYDDTDALLQELVVDRAGEQCNGKPCWKAAGTRGLLYRDSSSMADGVTKLALTAGDTGRGRMQVRAKNNGSKGQFSLPIGLAGTLQGNVAPTIQLLTSDGFCVRARMTEVTKDKPGLFAARKR